MLHKMFCKSCLSQELQPSCSCACYICSSLITIWNYNEPEKRLNSIWSRLGKQMTTLWWIVLNCSQAGTILVEIYLCCWMFTAGIWDDVSKSRVSKLICPAGKGKLSEGHHALLKKMQEQDVCNTVHANNSCDIILKKIISRNGDIGCTSSFVCNLNWPPSTSR